ncbi:hypothetical protein CRI77_22415 [Mycolicibacterium duvalii]|uniref:Uncharacterized protein n=1 Tax=Mycolicibacterium duvalii TaxID=39688 RepID=A0A7I7JVW4_9MYCO|nr:hypothetical protein [Mycolicibacterium duvalii]MCV7368528.1 hypothetical protein [Mycolicibacterium duvalii]PEG36737.1 hypothetical protein CRI77_22415 [Mycolicibacterium duvalii]BBX15222.1 hypothetical protein MDUV_00820 [Mycolicibacterium duvalii]
MTTTAPDTRRWQFLDDYCPQCNPLGHNADSRVRLASLTEPTEVRRSGSTGAVCRYVCTLCGHTWTRSDLWTAQSAGLDTKQPKEAA